MSVAWLTFTLILQISELVGVWALGRGKWVIIEILDNTVGQLGLADTIFNTIANLA